MSYTEINDYRGMPYGGMPHGAMLERMEVTDPVEVARVQGRSNLLTPGEEYDEYARAEIVDRTPDDPYLASDQIRRNDGGLSRSVLNVRYKDGRGSSDRMYPRHPEMFMGFMGNDPRGADTQPRFDKMRKHTEARMVGHVVRMGKNVGVGDLQVASRPWTATSIQRGEMTRRKILKERMRWFISAKEGRPWGRNMVADEFFGSKKRHSLVDNGGEGVDPAVGGDPRKSGDPVRGVEGMVPSTSVALGDAIRAQTESKGEADLPIQRYVGVRARCERFGDKGTGGARAESTAVDQEYTRSEKNRPACRADLARTMRSAMRSARTREAKADQAASRSTEVSRFGSSNPELGRDITKATAEIRQDDIGRVLPDDVGGDHGPGAGLGGPGDRQAITRQARQAHTSPAAIRLQKKADVRRALRVVSASKQRGALNNALPTSVRTSAVGNFANAVLPGGARGAKDLVATRYQSKGNATQTAIAQGFEVQNYGNVAHRQLQHGATTTAHDSRMQASNTAQRFGVTSAPHRRGGAQDNTSLGDATHRVFNTPIENSADVGTLTSGGGNSTRRNDLRPTSLSGSSSFSAEGLSHDDFGPARVSGRAVSTAS
jgi:hypothetical protein